MDGLGTGLLPGKSKQIMDDNERRFERIDERFNEIDRRFNDVDKRFGQVDVRLARIETRLDQMATREDLEHAINSVVKWVVGTMLGAAIAAVTVMTFVLNNAVPKPAAASMPAPIIIQLPPPGQVAVPAKPP